MSDGRPNIVFVLSDNVGWGDFERSLAKYPNIKPGQEFTGYKAKPGS